MSRSNLRTLALSAPALAVGVAAGCGFDGGEPPPDGPPMLVVMVVVDQLGGELVERYDTLFTAGLRRALDQGRVFPGSSHRHAVTSAGEGRRNRADWVGDTPFPDRAVLELVSMGVDSLELGQRGVVDYLGVAFSQTDYVGHDYGPRSQEQLDNLLRLDEVLGELLTLLDERVGRGRWILGLSADHGVQAIPEHMAAEGPPGVRSPLDADPQMARRVHEVGELGLGTGEHADSVRAALAAFPWVADALLADELAGDAVADSFVALHRASYHPERRTFAVAPTHLMVRERERIYVTDEPQGTGHGSPYWYDRWVPLVVMSPGVVPGPAPPRPSPSTSPRRSRRSRESDFPTISTALPRRSDSEDILILLDFPALVANSFSAAVNI